MAKSLANISVETIKHIMREYLRKGHDIRFIRASLIKAGVPKSKLDQAQREISRPKKPAMPPKKIKKRPKRPLFGRKRPKRQLKPLKPPKVKRAPPKPFVPKQAYKPRQVGYFWKIFLPLIIIVILIISLIVVFSAGAAKDCGADERCFIDLANECKAAKLKNTVDTTNLEYITKNCKLTKKITGLSPDEPKEVVDLFMGLTMTCEYQRGMFDRAYIEEISGNLETCTGPLATVIRELRR